MKANYRLPRRTHTFFLKRVVKYLAFHSIMRPDLWGLIVKTCRLMGVNHDEIITVRIRVFIAACVLKQGAAPHSPGTDELLSLRPRPLPGDFQETCSKASGTGRGGIDTN